MLFVTCLWKSCEHLLVSACDKLHNIASSACVILQTFKFVLNMGCALLTTLLQGGMFTQELLFKNPAGPLSRYCPPFFRTCACAENLAVCVPLQQNYFSALPHTKSY
uniref:Uncharacterized protein n=1 Tax=Sphaerodactylus townsendi TaxID=933632 RepID=A0ACB8EM12_9SAUR